MQFVRLHLCFIFALTPTLLVLAAPRHVYAADGEQFLTSEQPQGAPVTLIVANDGSGDYTTVQAAIDAAPSHSPSTTTIFIRPGVYYEKIVVPREKKRLRLVGESYENTILTYDDYAGKTSDYASTRIAATDFIAENLTFQNTIDSRIVTNRGQAAALWVEEDRAIFVRCRMMGFQDTLYNANNRRSYHKDCIIEGTTDFIYGNGIAVFDHCLLLCRKDSFITAQSQVLIDGQPANRFGYVFLHCQVKCHPNEKVFRTALGRPWGNAARVAYLNCELDSLVLPEGWSEWAGRDNHQNAFFAEYRNHGPGNRPAERISWSRQLTDAEAAEYTVENIFRADSTTAVQFSQDWNPATVLSQFQPQR